MADRLIAAGLIGRQPHPDSRRELVVELTSHGRDVVAAVTGHQRH
jgi:DNA-binding MarR family transcriptional regulator